MATDSTGQRELPSRTALRRIVEFCDAPFDRVFGAPHNPLKQLGALGWFFYWIVAGSGIYLYAFFDTGITNAYASVEWLTHDQWYLGGVMRSVHRYASDGMVVVMALHIAREFANGRYRGARAFSWISGLPVAAFLIGSGITGYWLVWDELAQYIAIVTSEWLDGLGIFGSSITHNFLNAAVLSDRFFTLMAFLHIALPLILLLGLWIHVQRQSHARVKPTRTLGIGTGIGLLALSLISPAISQPPADLDRVAAVVGLDWFYLAGYPLLDVVTPLAAWGIALAVTFAFALVPYLPKPAVREIAVVDLGNCNGCGRCVADCPFNAISLEPRSDATPYSHEAVVAESQCTGCNVCMGSCPTATPFRRASALVAGIQVPSHSVASLRAATEAATANSPKVLVYACEQAQRAANAEAPGAVVTVPCVGALPPSFFDFVLSKRRTDGLLLAGCRECDCHYRLGGRWTLERIARTRDPMLRARVPSERIEVAWAGHSRRDLRAALARLHERLAATTSGAAGS